MLTGIRPSYMPNSGLRAQQNRLVQQPHQKKEVTFSGSEALSLIDPDTRNLVIGLVVLSVVAPIIPLVKRCFSGPPSSSEV